MILSKSDLDPQPYFLRGFLGLTLDIDFIMVNQFMFTFRRETGYLHNNSTSSQWVWRDHHFKEILQNPVYDYKEDYFTWFCMFFIYNLYVIGSLAIFGTDAQQLPFFLNFCCTYTW